MTTERRVAGLGVLAAVAGLAGAANAQAVDARYGWSDGLELQYRIESSTRTRIGDGPENSVTTLWLERHKVVESRARRADIEITPYEMVIEIDAGDGGTYSFNSTDENGRDRRDDPEAVTSTYLLDHTYTMTQERSGSPRGIEGHAEVKEETIDRFPARRRPLLEQHLRSDEALLAELAARWQVVPGEDVEVGDSWEVSFTQPFESGELEIEMTYTLVGVSEMGLGHTVLEIESEGTIGIASFEAPGARLRIRDSECRGLIEFHRRGDLGFVVSHEFIQTYSARFSMDGRSLTTATAHSVMVQLEEMNIPGGAAPPGDGAAAPAGDRPREEGAPPTPPTGG